MLIIKFLFFVLVISFVNSVPIDENKNSNSNRLSTRRATLETYRYNHPPSISIPVSVVFEENEPGNDKPAPVVAFKEEKVSKINELKSEKPDSSQNNQVDTKETKNGEQITESTIFTYTESVESGSDTGAPTANSLSAEPKSNEEKSKFVAKTQPKQYYQLEYQIPVAVVYDEPINVVQRSRRLKNSKAQVRERNLRRRLPNSTSTTDLTENIEATTASSNTQKEPLKGEVKPNTRRRQRVKQTREKSSFEDDIPVVIQFTENENQSTLPKRKQEKSSTTVTPLPTTQASFAKLTTKSRTQSNIPLQAQNRNTSFKSQQMEERRQDNESAAKRKRDPVIPIVKSDNHAYGNSGSFSYSYEGGDGTKAFEKGELKTYENDKTGESVIGGFTYKDKDGNDISLSYTADENGYRPVGDHLPTPPPIPVAIQRALEHLATKTTPAPVTEATKV